MITDLLEVKSILGLENTLLTSADVNTVIGTKYRIYSNTTGDFTNIGAADNDVDTTFTATGDTPTAWGDGVLLVISAQDDKIERLIPVLTDWIVKYCNNDFTAIDSFDVYGNEQTEQNSYISNTFSFSGSTITDSESGLDFLLFSDFKIVGLTPNKGFYTVSSQSAGSITVEEAFTTVDNDRELGLYGVSWPYDLAEAMAYMIDDEIKGNGAKNGAGVQSETIGKYSVSYGQASANYNLTNYNAKSINILNAYRKVSFI